MKKLIPCTVRVADSSQPGRGERGRGAQGRRVPGGHVPVRVGEEMERFAVRAELLGRPAFLELLRLSAQEYGYEQAGVLRIPCPVDLFRRALAADAGDAALLPRNPIRNQMRPSVEFRVRV